MIQAIIFDIGGVLAHDVWEHLFLDDDGMHAKYPQLDKAEMFRWGKSIWGRFAYTPETPQTDWRALECQYWEAFLEVFHKQLPASASPDEFIELSLNFFRPVQGMSALLEKLRAEQVMLGICSDNNEFWYRRQADCAGFDKFIDSDKIILSNRVGKPKRSAQYEMFEAVTRAVGVPKRDCIFVDDRAPCLERAQEFGLTGILFPAQAAFGAQYVETLIEKMQLVPRPPLGGGKAGTEWRRE
jgi:HAD superfamily hydrolase (TIGR01509 family)